MAGVLVQGEVAACEGERHTETPPSQSLHCILHVALYTGRASLPMAGISSPLYDSGEPGPCLVMPLMLIMMAVYMGRALLGV